MARRASREKKSGTRLRLRQGEEIEGWVVTAESAKEALLVKSGTEVRLQLFASDEEEAGQ